MAALKAKPIRIIDILGTINQDEYISIIYNHGREEYWNTAKNAELDFKKSLGTEIIALTARGGNVRIFI